MNKRCYRCGLTLSDSCFNKNKATKDGLSADCRLCRHEDRLRHNKITNPLYTFPLRWTFALCKETALLYKTKADFAKNYNGAYQIACKNNWIDLICGHMIPLISPRGYWTKERCDEKASHYSTKKEFRKMDNRAYSSAYKKGWIDDICLHMVVSGNKFKRCIYSYEFTDGCVYVGLTYNIDERQRTRNNQKSDAVIIHIKETGLSPIRKLLTDYIDVDIASKQEGVFVAKYKEEGWTILNRAKTGHTGGSAVKWTKENCLKEAIKYQTRNDFMENSSVAYVTSCKKGWHSEICKHMVFQTTPNGTYTKSLCGEIASKYYSKKELATDFPYIMNAIYRNRWIGDLCGHMKDLHQSEEFRENARLLNIKAVYQYTLTGDYMTMFDSAQSASIGLGLSYYAIRNCCSNPHRYKTSGGFKWSYSLNAYNEEINKSQKEINLFDE